MLRPGRLVQRRAVIRGVSFALQRGRQSTASLDTRRLAAGQMGIAACPGCRCASASESTVGTVAVENFRQPPAQSCLFRVDINAAARLDRAASELVLDVDG